MDWRLVVGMMIIWVVAQVALADELDLDKEIARQEAAATQVALEVRARPQPTAAADELPELEADWSNPQVQLIKRDKAN